MNELNFNKEEKRYISAFLSQGKLDWLWYELAAMVPCIIVIVVGIIYDSPQVFGTGLIAYFIYRFWNIFHYIRKFPLLKSIFEKIDTTVETDDDSKKHMKELD